jgi:hypothetical protein
MTVPVKRPWEFMTKGLDFGALPLKASHYDRPSQEAVGVHDQRLGLWGFAFESFTLCPTEGSDSYILLAMYLQPISLDSQQRLAIQSHGFSTWTAIV